MSSKNDEKEPKSYKRGEMIYNIHSAGYPYRMIGELLGLTKQYVYELYQKHERYFEDRLDKTCTACREHKQTVTTHCKIPLCRKCYNEIKKIRSNKWKREHEKD